MPPKAPYVEPGISTTAPLLERAVFIEKQRGTSRTGRAQTKWTLHMPQEPTRLGRLFIIGGYGGVEKAYFPVARELAVQGMQVVTAELPTNQHWHHQYHPDHALRPERLLAQLTRRIIHDVNNLCGSQPVHVAGHSTGGVAAASIAEFEPGLVESVNLWESAGLGKKGILRHGSRIPQVGLQIGKRISLLHAQLGPLAPDIASDYLRYMRNAPRRGMEAIAVSRSDIVPTLERVQAAGTHVGAILAQHDEFFHPDEVLSRILPIVDDERIVILNNCHVGPQTNPEEHAKAQVHLLDTYRAMPLQPAA